MADKETNTECMFRPLPSNLTGSRASLGPRLDPDPPDPKPGIPVIKRSQTFTPSAAVNKANYICRVSLISYASLNLMSKLILPRFLNIFLFNKVLSLYFNVSH